MNGSNTSYITTTRNVLEKTAANTGSSNLSTVFVITLAIYGLLTSYSIIMAALVILKFYREMKEFKKCMYWYAISSHLQPIMSIALFLTNKGRLFSGKSKIAITAFFLTDMTFFILLLWSLSIQKSKKICATGISATLAVCLIISASLYTFSASTELWYISWFLLVFFKIIMLITHLEIPNEIAGNPIIRNGNNRVDCDTNNSDGRGNPQIEGNNPDLPPHYNQIFTVTLHDSDIDENK